MSNEFDEQHEGHAHFIGFIPSAEAMQQRQEQARMANHAAVHGVHDLMADLTEAQMVNLHILVRSLADPDTGPTLAAHVEGIMKMHFHFRFGWCKCGEKHMSPEDLLVHEPPKPAQNNAEEIRESYGAHWSEESPDEVADRVVSRIMNEGQAALMEEYRLVQLPGGVTEVQCKGCGIQYPSLRDRMLRDPDDCSGCHQKAKNG